MNSNKLIVTPDGWKHWILEQNFVEYSKIIDKEIIVPKGFRTDLASVPRLLWVFIPPMGRYSCASVVHDYLCTINYNRKEADKVFYELMIKYKTYTWKAKIMYIGVRIGAHYSNLVLKISSFFG